MAKGAGPLMGAALLFCTWRCNAEEWRVTNAAALHSTLRVAEIEFYADAGCRTRLKARKATAYVRPLPPNTQLQPPVEHKGEDCWGPCDGRPGACSWCGLQGACCKQGSSTDPAECERAVGFSQTFHECVALLPPGCSDEVGGGLPSPASAAFDEDLETSITVPCGGLDGCAAGTVVLGAEVETDPGQQVRCAVLLQPAEHLSTSGATTAPAPVRLVASRTLRQRTSCPGACRSGNFVESPNSSACPLFLHADGRCTEQLEGAIDCRACHVRWGPHWEEALLPFADRQPRFGGAFVATRLRASQGGALEGARELVVSALQGARGGEQEEWESEEEQEPLGVQALHAGADCWGYCLDSNGTTGAGFCSWCGQGGACCKSGSRTDPAECQGVTDFVTDHHECVLARYRPARAAPRARQGGLGASVDVPPWFVAALMGTTWGVAGSLAFLLFRPVRRLLWQAWLEFLSEGSEPAGATLEAQCNKVAPSAPRVDLLRPVHATDAAAAASKALPLPLREHCGKLV